MKRWQTVIKLNGSIISNIHSCYLIYMKGDRGSNYDDSPES